jgi:hypothetical protein
MFQPYAQLFPPPDQWSTQAILGFTLSDPLLLTVGEPPCLVMLCPKSPRRDKVCPLYRVRNWGCTNILQTPQKPYGPVENIYSTSSSKNKEIWTAESFSTAHTSFNTKEIKGVTWFQTNLSLDVQSVQRMFQEWKGVTWNKSFKPLCIHSYTNSIATVCGLTTEIFYYKGNERCYSLGNQTISFDF